MEKADNRTELLQEFVFGLWRLWKNRNNVLFNQRCQSPTGIVECWRRNIVDYQNAQASRELVQPPSASVEAHVGTGVSGQWKKPIFGVLKINTDAAWCKVTKRADLGWVVRDFAGILQAARGTGSWRFHSTAAAEAAAIREALRFCVDQNLRM